MRHISIFLCAALAAIAPPALADDERLSYAFELSFERSALNGLSLGAEPAEDREVEADYEFEIDLEYEVNNQFYLFFTGALIDETETVESAGTEEHVSGLERKQMGFAYLFGDTVRSELDVGRMEFVSASERWLWWDEELDAIRLESAYADFYLMLALAEEQARESTGVDFIDPEIDGVRRALLSLDWEFAPAQTLIFYYLDQSDDSSSLRVGEFEDAERVDEEDADLRWTGISYLAEFESERLGAFELELHAARVSGDETVYEFDDPEAGRAAVEERTSRSVSGSAHGIWLSWTPPALDELSFIVGRARGSGDRNPDDRRNKSFRQSGLQGDSESLGELYQPELSNLVVNLIGVEWELADGVQLAVLGFDYAQDERAGEMRDVSIENDLTGDSRDLGRELDLVLTVEARDGLELILTAAEFDPGSAYGALSGETASFFNLELVFEF